MNKIYENKIFAWLGFAAVIVLLVCTFPLRHEWWAFTDIFFFFMAAFCNLCAVTLKKINPIVAKKLWACAFWLLVLAVIALIAVWIVFNF